MQDQAPRSPHEDFSYIDYSAVRHIVGHVASHIPHPFQAIGELLDKSSAAVGSMAGPQPESTPPVQPVREAPDYTTLERHESRLARLEALQAKASNPLSKLATSALVRVQMVLNYGEHRAVSAQADDIRLKHKRATSGSS